jgi:hypothetical protein
MPVDESGQLQRFSRGFKKQESCTSYTLLVHQTQLHSDRTPATLADCRVQSVSNCLQHAQAATVVSLTRRSRGAGIGALCAPVNGVRGVAERRCSTSWRERRLSEDEAAVLFEAILFKNSKMELKQKFAADPSGPVFGNRMPAQGHQVLQRRTMST